VSETAPSGNILGVASSLKGRRWVGRGYNDRDALAIAQKHNLPEIVARVLAGRGVGLDDVPVYLEPTLRDHLPDPSAFRDMDKAADILVDAINATKAIAIFGDYDVDGATSTALLTRFFRALGSEPIIYIPDRIAEGYGPNTAAMRALKERGADIVITVDCGILSFEPLAAAKEIGLDVIVVDHHKAEPDLPICAACINPNRLDDDSGHGQLAAVGVAFLLAVATSRALRAAGWYKANGVDEPDLMSLLDLVALGTVCDVAPITGVNRALVGQGLKIMGGWRNIGLRSLADVAGVKSAPGTYHAGFQMGPRVNAGGRVGKSDLGAILLSTGDKKTADAIATELDFFNRERQAIEAAVQEKALEKAATQLTDDGMNPCLIVAGAGWHPGVVGIVASRLKDRFRKPTIIIGVEDGVGKGSGRSVPGVDLGAAVIAAKQAGLLVNGGGHAMAAGLTVAEGAIDELRIFLNDRLADAIAVASGENEMALDGALRAGGANVELLGILDQAGPFGAANPEPTFAIEDARIIAPSIVGQDHVRCTLTDDGGARLKAIAFRSADNPLGQGLLSAGRRRLHVAGKLRADDWGGRVGVQLQIEDAAWADATN
jgi:single-stranded-DNA-specific exonuclease